MSPAEALALLIPGGGGFGFLLAAILWLLPGAFLARLLRQGGREDPVLFAAASAGFATAASTLVAFAGAVTGFPAGRFDLVLAALGILALAGLVLVRRRRIEEEPADGDPRDELWDTLGLVSIVLMVAAGAWIGSTLRISADAPDHVGTLREILTSGRFFPTEAFHLGAGSLGFDPRKGLLNPVYAGLSDLAGMNPVDFWRLLPALTAVFPFLAGYGFLRWTGFTRGWALVGGWIVVLTWNQGPGGDLFAISAYPNQAGADVFWLATGASLAALRAPGPARLTTAALLAWAAVAVHPMYVVFLAMFYAIAGCWALFAAPRRGDAVAALVVMAAGAGLVLVPYLFYRFGQYAPANPIHTEIQGMLFLSDRFYVADPGRLWIHLGWAGLVGYPVALVVYLRHRREGLVPFYVIVSILLMGFLTLNPFVVPILQTKLTYLVFRTFWLLPPGIAVGLALPLLLSRPSRALAEGSFGGAAQAVHDPRAVPSEAPAPRARGRRIWAGVLAVAVLLPALATLPRWPLRSPERDGRGNALAYRRALEDLDHALPNRSVILSDPVTSYLLPTFTSQRVVAPFDQHSSPNDSLAVPRTLAARDVLSLSVPVREAWRLARKWNAAYVVVNTAFPRGISTNFWSYDRAALERREEELAASPYFRSVFEDRGLVAFRVLPEPLPERWTPPSTRETFPAPAVRDTLLAREGVALLSARASADTIACSDTLRMAFVWASTRDDLPPQAVHAALRLDALNAPGRGLPAEKMLRKIAAKLRGERYRYRTDWIPGGGRLAPDHWPRGRALADTVRVRPPCALAPGPYAVTVTVNRLPNMPNLRLRDYWSDADLYSGPAVDTVQVVRRR
jgi:hypothetical protein